MKVLILFFLFSSSLSLNAGNSIYFELQGQWTYAIASETDTVDRALTYDFTPVENLNKLFPLANGQSNYLWLKLDFSADLQFQESILSIYLGKIAMQDTAYLNGHYLGSTGDVYPDYNSAWNIARQYSFPAKLLNYQDRNILLIKIFGDGEMFINGRPKIGTSPSITSIVDRENLLSIDVNMILSLLIFTIGLYHLLLFIKRRKDKENLYYALLSFCFAIYQSNFYAYAIGLQVHHWFPYLMYQKIIFSMSLLAAFFLIEFFKAFLKTSEKQFIQHLRIFILLLGLIALWAIPSYSQFLVMSTIVSIVILLVFSIYSMFILVKAVLDKKLNAWLLLIGLTPLFITVCYDILVHQILESDSAVYLGAFGFPAFLLVIMLILAERFAQDRTNAEDLNINLEKKVEQRTQALSESNSTLNETLNKLSATYEIAKKDMALAVAVQQGLIAPKYHKSPEWEVYIHYQPMSGVSGDFYDIFLNGNSLDGICLFDASGHGVAAGLITMIAQTIVKKHFAKNNSLANIMGKIDNDLTHELGDVNNYLSGIFLRFNQDIVEYVNAGHPDMLFRSGKSGLIKAISLPEDEKGCILGAEGISSSYKSARMKSSKNDSFLIFTDALYESKNQVSNNEYGMLNLIKSFHTAPNGSTKEVMEHILENLFQYTGGKDLDDDLTIVLVKRLI